jgi:hypothetical protein
MQCTHMHLIPDHDPSDKIYIMMTKYLLPHSVDYAKPYGELDMLTTFFLRIRQGVVVSVFHGVSRGPHAIDESQVHVFATDCAMCCGVYDQFTYTVLPAFTARHYY